VGRRGLSYDGGLNGPYVYDVFNRRIAKAVDTTSPFTMTDAVIERYVYDDITGVASLDGGNVVLDFVDPDGEGSTTIDFERRYLYGNAVDQILAQEDVTESTSSADRVYWPLGDHLGTVRDLAKNDGTLGEHYEYDSYGNVLSGDTSVTRYLFTSREFDEDTGLQYNRARWYDAAVGRWVSEDPIGFGAGDANLARYVGNNSMSFVDPSGLEGIEIAEDHAAEATNTMFSSEWWNEPLYDPVPVWARGRISSMIFPPNEANWSGEPDDPNNTTRFEIFMTFQANVVEAALMFTIGADADLLDAVPRPYRPTIRPPSTPFNTSPRYVPSTPRPPSPAPFRPFRPTTSSTPTSNLATATEYYMQAGNRPATTASHINYMDLNRPVQAGYIPKGEIVQQYVGPKGTGNYFGPVGTTQYESGIVSNGTRPTLFLATDDVPALQSFNRPNRVYPPKDE
jgi:RHS repeat-associated protein